MSDEAALLNVIAAHPAEDTPRLMYADWLDEHRQHVRAEFIRGQIEIARIEQLPRIELNQYVGIFQRNQDLLDNHRAELLGPLTALPAEVRVEFSRGFVSELTLYSHTLFTHGNLFAALRPRPYVTVNNAVGPIRHFLGIDAAYDKPPRHLDIVTAIRTMPEREDEDDNFPAERGETLLDPQLWLRLEVLDISGCQLGELLAGDLFRRSGFPALTNLDLSGNDLTDAAVDSLLASSLPRQLKRLILGGNDITDAGALALAERWPTGADDQLESLNLRFTPISQAGQAALLRRFGGRVDLF